MSDTPATNPVKTSDLGFLIRDRIDYAVLDILVENSNGDVESVDDSQVVYVDAADPDNLKVHLETGEVFRVTIVREG